MLPEKTTIRRTGILQTLYNIQHVSPEKTSIRSAGTQLTVQNDTYSQEITQTRQDKQYIICTPSEDADQPTHTGSQMSLRLALWEGKDYFHFGRALSTWIIALPQWWNSSMKKVSGGISQEPGLLLQTTWMREFIAIFVENIVSIPKIISMYSLQICDFNVGKFN